MYSGSAQGVVERVINVRYYYYYYYIFSLWVHGLSMGYRRHSSWSPLCKESGTIRDSLFWARSRFQCVEFACFAEWNLLGKTRWKPLNKRRRGRDSEVRYRDRGRPKLKRAGTRHSVQDPLAKLQKRKKCWQWAKHAWLHFDLLRAWKGETLTAPMRGTERDRLQLDYWLDETTRYCGPFL